MRLAAFAALLRLVDGVVVVMVPLGPEFPPDPLTVHGQVDELTCRAGRTGRLVPKASHLPPPGFLSGRMGGVDMKNVSHRGAVRLFRFSAHNKKGEWEKPHSVRGWTKFRSESYGAEKSGVGRLSEMAAE